MCHRDHGSVWHSERVREWRRWSENTNVDQLSHSSYTQYPSTIHSLSIHSPSNVHPMSMKYSHCHPSLMVFKDDCHELAITQWFSSAMITINCANHHSVIIIPHGSLHQKAILITHWYSCPVIPIRVVLITHSTHHCQATTMRVYLPISHDTQHQMIFITHGSHQWW